MNFIYNIVIHPIYFILKIIALFNSKINLFVNGRKKSFQLLETIKPTDKTIWFHAASLGEFEQGRPIIEYLKKSNPDYKIVLTFFSPSGYEVRKNYNKADVICYLPFDTKRNMQKFISLVHPEVAIIIKYEFWPNLLNQLKKENITTILASGIFREKQLFFKPYGAFMRKKLEAFHHFFVQNESSKNLLNSINFSNVTISGDTRFDRVYDILQQKNHLDFIKDFQQNCFTIVAGSTWKEDEELLIEYINTKMQNNEKVIIAPHNINHKEIARIKNNIQTKKVILFSEHNNKKLSDYDVLIIDTIGLLTKIYAHADIAYVGGGLATGLHNILEPATYGIPVIFGGKKHFKFQEAIDLINRKSVTIVTDFEQLSSIFVTLKANKSLRESMGTLNIEYIRENIGATKLITDFLHSQLK
ncbi:3-deoxy-D-manno-octulosonic acid transferase [Tenacibaculum sp. 190524A02b]|uniref:3-deoxy-D-manno-octulosonic acid transferase n=1 Tax=Tenacibaculum vairaonense TaxID=3137860 RepID=UPI0031FB26FA